MMRWFRWLQKGFIGPVRQESHAPDSEDRSTGRSLGVSPPQQMTAERDAFRFAPELFEVRTQVIVELSERGFDWLSHYSSVDPMHDVYGIEVCGILDKDDAVAIGKLLAEMFPDWTPGCLCYKDYGREPGWKAKVQRDRDRPDEQWETA
jgi:hypothetical protein